MLNISKMISSAQQALGWPYVSPGSNNFQGIDCSGLFVKIYRDQGMSIYHGSNRIFRKYCSETGKITKVSQLQPGMAVFKWKDQQPAGYNDNLGDFSHIGLVVSSNPLRIIHASSAAGYVTTDTKIGKWAYWGKLTDVDYGGNNMSEINEQVKEPEMEPAGVDAVVFSENGGAVKMRAKPSTSCATYWELPNGTSVTILDSGETWSKIKHGSRIGYMMSKFLSMDGTAESETKTVTVSGAELWKAYEIIEKALGQFLVNKGDLEKAYDIIGDMLGLRG